jgi:hypothetical protein
LCERKARVYSATKNHCHKSDCVSDLHFLS